MKRVLNIICLASILTSAAALSASAGADTWNIIIRGGHTVSSATVGGTQPSVSGSLNTATARTNTLATTLDDNGLRDPSDGGLKSPPPNPGVIAYWYRPEWQLQGNSDASFRWGYNNDVKRPLRTSPNLVKTWTDLIVFATEGYSYNEIQMSIDFSTGTNAPPKQIDVNGQPQAVVYKLVLTWAPAGYAGPTEWLLPTLDNGGHAAKIVLPAAGAISNAPIEGTGPLTATQTAGYRFSLITPEPGTMLALGAGLASMAGMIRRRKA